MNAYVFLGGGTPWVYALAAELAQLGSSVKVIAPYDLKNFFRLRPDWPEAESPTTLSRTFWVFPPGYVGILARFFAPVLRWRLDRAQAEVAPHEPPWVIVTYPWFNRTVRNVPDERLVYYNLDDYTLYNPPRAALIQKQEDEILQRAALTICLSQRQTEVLRTRVSPDRARRIRHFPLGVVKNFINCHPEHEPRARTVGYVGNLTDRVDWRLVMETARTLPSVEFVFVGSIEETASGGARPDWKIDRAAVLSLPNVRRVGPVRQQEVPGYYWNFGINWIPYATDHAFNDAACPTKIMDGLASGRPVLSTDLPECRQYREWIILARTAIEMVDQIRMIFNDLASNGRASYQVEFARRNSWENRAKLLRDWLLRLQSISESTVNE